MISIHFLATRERGNWEAHQKPSLITTVLCEDFKAEMLGNNNEGCFSRRDGNLKHRVPDSQRDALNIEQEL